MLDLDGQVHHDTHAVPMGNYVIEVGNYVIATPSELGNYKIADSRGQGPGEKVPEVLRPEHHLREGGAERLLVVDELSETVKVDRQGSSGRRTRRFRWRHPRTAG